MKRKPDYDVGDKIIFKAGDRGEHFGFDNNSTAEVVELKDMSDVMSTKGEWDGWLVKLSTSNTFFPAGWFKKHD